jgi:hypothetical protein
VNVKIHTREYEGPQCDGKHSRSDRLQALDMDEVLVRVGNDNTDDEIGDGQN